MDGNDLRARVRRPDPLPAAVLMPGVWDPLSTLLARQAGFDVVFVSGYAVAGSLLGVPDIGYLGQTEMAEVARRIAAAAPAASPLARRVSARVTKVEACRPFGASA